MPAVVCRVSPRWPLTADAAAAADHVHDAQ
eukprot:COSAG01_NODE_63580_length_279_cov_1.072222_1_plen_29_part_10